MTLKEANAGNHFGKKSLCKFLLALLLIIGCLSIPLTRAVLQDLQTFSTYGRVEYHKKQLSRLHTDGLFIRNESDQIVLLTGIGWQELCFQDHLEEDPYVRAAKMKSYGFNFVRLWLNWRIWKNESLGEDYKDTVDKCVQACIDNGLYIIPGFMSASYPIESNDYAEYSAIGDDPTEWIEWCKEVIRRYYNISNVCGFFIMNEPLGFAWEAFGDGNFTLGGIKWIEIARQCAQSISEDYSEILILVPAEGTPTTHYGRGIDSWVINDPIEVPNVVYTFHRYYYQDVLYRDQNPDYVDSYEASDYEKARQELEQAWQEIVFSAMNAGRCCMHEEFGFDPNRPEYPEPAWDHAMNDTLSLMNRKGLSWCYVAWWPGGYGPIEDDWETLSPQGKILVKYLQPLPS
jgi:aryl-phospho-beta-D-glucosidase BglC (GH1 family)